MAIDWLRLQLDLNAFDETPFLPILLQCEEAGIDFTTMAEVGDTVDARLALYELNKTCSADIPQRGPFHTYEDYITERIDVPTYEPRGVVLAVLGGTWIGMASTSLHHDYGARRYVFSEMTGVLAPHRGRGISLAMKLLAIRFAISSGYRWLRTFHHPDNASAIGMNWRLGFVDEDKQMWSARP